MHAQLWEGLYSMYPRHMAWAACLSFVAVWVLYVLQRRLTRLWALRKVPNLNGIWGYTPLLGDLLSVLHNDVTTMYQRGVHSKQFPTAFVLWIGSIPDIVITDVDLARRLLVRLNRRFDLEHITVRKPYDAKVFHSNPVFTNGEKWRQQRRATETAVMHSKALAAQVPFVSQCTKRVAQYLDRYAASGEPVDVQEAMWMMTADVVCYAAFGVDMHASESSYGHAIQDGWWSHAVGSPEFGKGLVNCLRSMLQENDLGQATIYNHLSILLPELHCLWMAMARVMPDQAFRTMCKVHAGAQIGVRKMIVQWKVQQQRWQDPAGNDVQQPNIAPSDGYMRPFKVRMPNGCARSSGGLLGRILSDEEPTANILEEHDILGLGLGTVLAGYETTGTSIAMSLYYLAANPTIQTKAQQEVDDVLQGKDPVLEDLDKLPYISGVFHETLRLSAPGSVAVRESTDETMDLGGGVIVPKGSWLIIPTLAFMRHPAIWPRATEFLPERHIQPGNEHLAPSNPNAFMPFGYGARLCVGFKFATMETRMALVRLLQRFWFEEALSGAAPPKPYTSITYKPDQIVLKLKHRAVK